MPRVKRYPDETQSPTLPRGPYALSPGRFLPEDVEAIEAMEIERDRDRARAVELDAARQLREIKQQIMAGTNLPASDATKAAGQRIVEARAQAISRAESPRMRAMLEDVLERRTAILHAELAAYSEQRRKAEELDRVAQELAIARQQALDAPTQLAFRAGLRTLHDAIDRQGKLSGQDAAETAAEKFRVTSRMTNNRIAQMLASGDLDTALAFRDANGLGLSARDDAEIETLLAEPLARRSSEERVDRLMGTFLRQETRSRGTEYLPAIVDAIDSDSSASYTRDQRNRDKLEIARRIGEPQAIPGAPDVADSDSLAGSASDFGSPPAVGFGGPARPMTVAHLSDGFLSADEVDEHALPLPLPEAPAPYDVEGTGKPAGIDAWLIPTGAQDLRTKIEDEGLYDGSAGLDMNSHIIAFARRHRETILRVSKRLGIPPSAVAAAIGEEYRTWGLFKDGVGESWTKLLVMLNGAPVHPRDRGRPLSTNSPSEYLKRSYLAVRERIKKGEVIQEGPLGKLITPMTMDVGPGNINIGTAMFLLEKYLEKNSKDDFLGLKGYVDNYDKFFLDFANPNSDLTIKIASLKIREVLDEFENAKPDDLGNSRVARDYFRALSPAHRDALLDFGYRRSPESVRKSFMTKDRKIFRIPRGWENRTRTDYNNGRRESNLFYDYFFDPASPYDTVNGILDGSNFPTRPRAKRPKTVPRLRGRDRYRMI